MRERSSPFFFLPLKQHKPKTIGDENSTICTAIDMKMVDHKSYMKSYKLTHETCSVKSEKCIFLMDQYSGCKDWSSVSWKHVWYCNMCAIRRREPKHEHVIITSMCSFAKIHVRKMRIVICQYLCSPADDADHVIRETSEVCNEIDLKFPCDRNI